MKKMSEIKYNSRIELARRYFWYYAKLKAPDFYLNHRAYLKSFCEELQAFYESDERVLIVNMPPRHGKSRTAGLFVEWVLGQNRSEKIMTASYNETLSETFSKSVRNNISEQKADADRVVYSEIFPGIAIKRGEGKMNLWSLEGGYNNYLATSPGGTATGFGATCFPAGTLISTEYGKVAIEDIVLGAKVLSYDHNSNRLRYNAVKATRRIISNEFIEITTNTGRKIKSTVDHRYYTYQHEYKRADELSVGDIFKISEVARCLSRVQTTKNRHRTALFKVLSRKTQDTNNSYLRPLWERIRGFKVSVRKGYKTRLQGELLQQDLLMQGNVGQPTTNKDMSVLRRGILPPSSQILQSKVQRNVSAAAKDIAANTVWPMRQSIYADKQQVNVLQYGMQKQAPFAEYARGREQQLQDRCELCDRFLQFKSICTKQGQSHVSVLWRNRDILTHEGRKSSNESLRTSQRPEQAKQRNGKSDNSMPLLPYSITQDEVIVYIERVNETAPVYDIQVENDNNFFANGILVHNCLIIDDLVKNAEEAYNENALAKGFDWFCNTMLSRLEEGGKIIVVMTRWASGDLAGRLFELYKDKQVRHITMKALQDDGRMLCEDVLSRESYEEKVRAMGADIASANYQQEPIDIKGKLYSGFKTYSELPRGGNAELLFTDIKNYTDTADTGDDYLCSICYGVLNAEAYVLDVVYTKEPMELTEPRVARMLHENDVGIADVESNNGGRGFARSVERILTQTHNSNRTSVKWFHQSANKNARILSNATWVMEHIYFPTNWRDRWPEFYDALAKYQREGKNKHDDAPDALTGVCEKIMARPLFEDWA